MLKIITSILAMMLIASSAIKASSVPLIPLLVKDSRGGFTPPEYQGWGSKLTIYSDGSVVKSSRSNSRVPWNDTTLAVISLPLILEITDLVAPLSSGAISFPDEPECTDRPITNFSARNASGTLVTFAQNQNCVLGILDGFYDAYRLQQILDGLDALASGY